MAYEKESFFLHLSEAKITRWKTNHDNNVGEIHLIHTKVKDWNFLKIHDNDINGSGGMILEMVYTFRHEMHN